IDIRERRQFEDRIRESEERYRTLVELSPDAIVVEREGMTEFVNSTAVKLLGAHSDADLVGKPILDLVHPDHRALAERQLTYLRRRRPLPPSEDRIVRLDGTPVDVEMAAMPIVFEGRPANQIVLRDITQRKQVEARLQENAKQLQQQAQLLNLAHDSIVVNDLEGRVVFWNPGAEQTYGWTRDEAMGKIIHDLLKTRFPSNLIEITAKLLSQGRWKGELTHTTKDGQTIVVSSRWALQRGEGSLPTGILVIDRDITLQKRAEQAMMEARRFAESITDTVQEALLVLNRDLQVISANQTFYRVFQVPPEETRGRYVYEIGSGQWDIPELRTLLEDILPHNTSFEDFEVTHEFDRIGRRTMLLNARRIHQQDQQTEMILLAIQDITIRKEQEKKIQEHQQELASLTEELLLAEERERHRIALMLHDSIGQSLAFSKRELGVLQKKSPESVREALEYVKEQIDLAVRQTRDLTFELSPTTLHTFGLEAAVEELVEQLAAHENLRYHFEATEEDKPLTEQIRTLLYRAARELLLNIIKHAEATNVSIRIDRQNKSVRMVIEDDGKGFDVSQLQRTARQQEGFGLFSIRERLTYVGGKFTIESQPGHGTKVTLVAPLNRENLVKSRSGKP
ncbi:MAG: PAS domain S-box protein, partial [Solirubrobacterales bacterium]